MGDFDEIMGISKLSVPVLEKVIERKVKDHARGKRWRTYKFSSPATPSVTDRIFINRFGVVLFIEFKQKGKKLTPKQEIHAQELKTNNANVFMIDNIDDGIALIDKWHNSVSVTHHDFF